MRKLSWSKCFSYGEDNEILLDENKVTQIIGTNGMGKSSIPLIIEEVLFNKNSKQIKKADIANRYLDGGYNISLDFSVDNDDYNITVVRKTNVKVILTKNGEDISSHTATNTYKTVEQLLGLDFKTFSQLVYQNTNSSLQFLTATDTNRKKFLIDLLHLEAYTNYFEAFKEAVRELNQEVIALGSRCSTVESWINENSSIDTTILPEVEIPSVSEKDIELSGDLRSKIKNFSEQNRKILQNQANKKRLNEINLSEYADVSIDHEHDTSSLTSELGVAKFELSEATKEIQKLETLGSVCPRCEQDIEETFKIKLIQEQKERKQSAAERIQEVEAKLDVLIKENNRFRAKQKAEREWENTYKSIDQNLPDNVLDEKSLKSELAEVEARIADTDRRVREATEKQRKITAHNTRASLIEEQSGKMKTELEKISAELDKGKHNLAQLEILKKAFSTNGLVAYKIENLVKDLEELTNNYLSELSDGRFTLGFSVQNDKLNVDITDNAKPVNITALSSGELARVNTATLLALRKLMSSISKSKINVLFLDEVISVLDEAGKEKLVEVLLQEDLNTYVVSHGWAHPLLARIEVIKNGNISSLEHYEA